VAAHILGPGSAASVAVEPGQRLGAAGLERPAEDVELLHATSIDDLDEVARATVGIGVSHG
jgi:hypothetical protein